jgi:hypothetical protein
VGVSRALCSWRNLQDISVDECSSDSAVSVWQCISRLVGRHVIHKQLLLSARFSCHVLSVVSRAKEVSSSIGISFVAELPQC